MMGYVSALMGDRKKARSVLKKLNAERRKGYINRMNLGRIYSALGDKELAFECLEGAYADHEIDMVAIKIDARWDALAGDRRLAALAQMVGSAHESI